MGLGSIGSSIGKAFKDDPFGSIGSAVSAAGGVQQMLAGTPKPYTDHLKKGIRWRVADAKKAGVHPLFALGASIGSPMPSTGSSAADGLATIGDAASRYGARSHARQLVQRQEARADREAASAARVNDTQAMLNVARAKSLEAELRNNPANLHAIETRMLDPSHGTHPDTGRLAWFIDSTGKYRRVDTSKAPQSALEPEYGEPGELQAIVRMIQSIPGLVDEYYGWRRSERGK